MNSTQEHIELLWFPITKIEKTSTTLSHDIVWAKFPLISWLRNNHLLIEMYMLLYV